METDIFISQSTCNKWIAQIENNKILYLHAMKGYGKTVQATEFAQRYFKIHKIFDAGTDDFFECAKYYIGHCVKLATKRLIIIDNVEQIIGKDNEGLFFNFLSSILHEKNIMVMLLSSAPLPNYLLPLKLSKKLITDNRKSLQLDSEQIVLLMKQQDDFSSMRNYELKKYANKCFEFSGGYAVAVLLYLQRLHEGTRYMENPLAESDLHCYFDLQMENFSEDERERLLRLCVFESFTLDMAEKAISENPKRNIADLLCHGYIEMLTPDEYIFEPNIYRYLQSILVKTDLFDPREILETAGGIYESARNMKAALHCYHLINNYDKIEEIVVYMSENADGCEFAEISHKYIAMLPEDRDKNNPRLLGAKAMMEAYTLQKSGYDMYLNRLKGLTKERNKVSDHALEIYIRTLIACPISNAEKLKDNLLLFAEYVLKNGVNLKFIMPTGNMPSLLNGGIDLLPWVNGNKMFHALLKNTVESIIGFEAIGGYHTIWGELYYERNQKTKAMESLAKGLDEVTRKGGIRMQYTATAVIAKLFCAENNTEKAEELLDRFYKKAQAEHFGEILPNISASMVQIALYKGEVSFCTTWLEESAPNEYQKFYLTQRFVLFTKAKVYVALGRDLEALHIITVLGQYCEIVERKYFTIELNILKAIIYYRRNEAWQEYLLQGTLTAYEYGLVRVLANEGVALLPLFSEIDWEKHSFSAKYIATVEKELRKVARFYPNYLKPVKKYRALTQKETDILHLISKGYKNEQIAKELNITLGTVKFHISNIINKFETSNRAAVIKIAHEEGLL